MYLIFIAHLIRLRICPLFNDHEYSMQILCQIIYTYDLDLQHQDSSSYQLSFCTVTHSNSFYQGNDDHICLKLQVLAVHQSLLWDRSKPIDPKIYLQELKEKMKLAEENLDEEWVLKPSNGTGCVYYRPLFWIPKRKVMYSVMFKKIKVPDLGMLVSITLDF